MKIDKSFYQLFSDFKYMLTHELDAYIFKDDLSKWCNLAYDYIGAPWFSGYDKPIKTDHVIGVGNSGLSLRNIQTCLAVLNCLNRFNLKGKLYSSQFSKQTFRLLTFLSSKLPVTQAKFYIVRAYLRNEYVHEDIFWCKFVPILFPDFKIASVQDALHFSFDASPRKCFNLNGGVLPFGCHAWHRFDPEFWDQFIPNKQNSRDTL